MCKELIGLELSRIFGCGEDKIKKIGKMLLKVSIIYLMCMLVTFIFAVSLASVGGKIGLTLTAAFSFLLMLEIGLLSTVLSIIIILMTVYYGGYFAARGWKRI